jgi:hypothetical protein
VTSYSLYGQIYNQPGSLTGVVNGVISCTVDQIANTTQCFVDMQYPANASGLATPPSGVNADALISINVTSTRAADGSVSWSYNGGVANPDGTSSSVSKTSSVDSYSVGDADGNKSTAGITFNPDGTSTITISSSDKGGNGTFETINVAQDGSLISDTTVQIGNGGVADSSDDGGDDDSG